MITNSIDLALYAWNSINVDTSFYITDSAQIQFQKLYNVRIFTVAPTTSTYTSTGNGWNSTPIYSGTMYLNNGYDRADFMPIIRDSIKLTPFFNINDVSSAFKTSSYSWDIPNSSSETIFYICISDPLNENTLMISSLIIPNYTYNINFPKPTGEELLNQPPLDIVSPYQILPTSFYIINPNATNTYQITCYRRYPNVPLTNITIYPSTPYASGFVRYGTHMLNIIDFIHNRLGYDISSLDNHFTLRTNIDNGSLKRFEYTFDPCVENVLYYRNLLGGWDWLVVRGKINTTHKFKALTYNTGREFGGLTTFDYAGARSVDTTIYYSTVDNYKLPYIESYDTEWNTEVKINLGWFTDDQAKRLIHLFTSKMVYLHNIKTNEITPIRITDNQFEEKRYKDNRAISKYSIKAVYNQNKNIK